MHIKSTIREVLGCSPSIMNTENHQKTFVMVKPDGVERKLVGEIISRLENRNLNLEACKVMKIDRGLAEKHYEMHSDKPFFSSLIKYITSGPVVAMVWSGEGAIAASRSTMGATDPAEATPGSIRGDFGLNIEKNLVHGSDSPESAQREVRLFFDPEELK